MGGGPCWSSILSFAENCALVVDETSTAGSSSRASMVEVESGPPGSAFEAWLVRCVNGEDGGEVKITSGSVDTAGLEGRTSSSGLDGPKGCESGSKFKKIAKML